MHKVNNQRLSTANVKDINADYYITNSTAIVSEYLTGTANGS